MVLCQWCEMLHTNVCEDDMTPGVQHVPGPSHHGHTGPGHTVSHNATPKGRISHCPSSHFSIDS